MLYIIKYSIKELTFFFKGIQAATEQVGARGGLTSKQFEIIVLSSS